MSGRLVRRSPLFGLAWAGLAALARLGAQESPIPEELAGRALLVRVQAETRDRDTVAWSGDARRLALVGTPTGFRLLGTDLLVLVQVTPLDEGENGVTLIAQSQVWFRDPSGALSYRTSLDRVEVDFAERLFFFPLGRAKDGSAPLRVIISVDRYRGEDLSAEAQGSVGPLSAPGSLPPGSEAKPASGAAGAGAAGSGAAGDSSNKVKR